MADSAHEIRPDRSLVAAIELGASTSRPKVEIVNSLGVTPHYIVRSPNGACEFVKSQFHAPNFKTGLIKVLDVMSFTEYFKKHSGGNTLVRANCSQVEIEAVLDWHGKDVDDAGRGDHCLKLVCVRTLEWSKMKASNGKSMSQSEFADFIDDLSHCFEVPDPASLTDIVLNLEGANNAAWLSKFDRVSGGVQIQYTQEAEAKTKSGVLFPTQGTVVMPVFVGGPPMRFIVKFQYRVNEGDLTIRFVLDQCDRWEREAFLETVAQTSESIEREVLLSP